MPGPYAGASSARNMVLPMMPPVTPKPITAADATPLWAEPMVLDCENVRMAIALQEVPMVARKMPKYRIRAE